MNPATKLIGHETIRKQFRTALGKGRLASSFLFTGPLGIGKRHFANYLAQAVFCDQNPPEQLDPCGVCPACQQVKALTHPDLHVIEKPADKRDIPVETLIGDREHRMREGLCHEIAMKPMLGQRKVAIIDDADHLNEEGANCLLKTLEEPAPGSLLILISTSPLRQLPTIRSRCQLIRFAPLTTLQVVDVLQTLELTCSPEEIQRAASCASGSVQAALDWLDEDLHEFRETLFRQLEANDVTRDDFAKTLSKFVESAGTEASVRRRRLDRVLELAIEFYQSVMVWSADIAETEIPDPTPIMHAAGWCRDPELAANCLQTCMNAQAALHANAHIPTLVDAWMIELGRVARGDTQVLDTFAQL